MIVRTYIGRYCQQSLESIIPKLILYNDKKTLKILYIPIEIKNNFKILKILKFILKLKLN